MQLKPIQVAYVLAAITLNLQTVHLTLQTSLTCYKVVVPTTKPIYDVRRQPSSMDSEVIYVLDRKLQVIVSAGGQAVMWCVTLNIYKRDFTSA